MKKVLSLILALSMVMILGSVSFAAPTVNVDSATYDEPVIEIIDEENAGGSTDTTKEGSDLNEVVPGGDARLPKTGGIPAEAFYGAGALIVLAALIVSRKKVKTASKG